MDSKGEFWRRRSRLVGLLSEVAELEHALCCAYLFAAFSMKIHTREGDVSWQQLEKMRLWKGALLFIARQEMAHLAISGNLLTALGELPYFRRPNFPTNKNFYPTRLPLDLKAFSRETLANFLVFELPSLSVDDREEPQVQDLLDQLDRSKSEYDNRLAQQIRARHSDGSRTIGQLYAEIRELIAQLGIDHPNWLLVGSPDAQMDNRLFVPAGTQMRPDMYGVVVTPVKQLEDALTAIQQIRVEGESAPESDRPGGHFSRFKAMYLGLSKLHSDDPDFVPGRNVVPNPCPSDMPCGAGMTRITHPFSTEAVSACDLGYEILVRMLLRLFAQTDEGIPDNDPIFTHSEDGGRLNKEVEALKAAVFFPMMTAVVRPFGEILTLLPATEKEDDTGYAGTAFQSPRRVDFLPHGPAAWRALHGQLVELRERVRALAERVDVPPEPAEVPDGHIRERLKMLYENIWRIEFNFAKALGLEDQR